MSNHYVSGSSPHQDLVLTVDEVKKTVRKNMAAGKEYTLTTTEKEDGKKITTRKQKIRCVGVYPYTVCFKNRRGTMLSLAYIDVCNMLQGKAIKI